MFFLAFHFGFSFFAKNNVSLHLSFTVSLSHSLWRPKILALSLSLTLTLPRRPKIPPKHYLSFKPYLSLSLSLSPSQTQNPNPHHRCHLATPIHLVPATSFHSQKPNALSVSCLEHSLYFWFFYLCVGLWFSNVRWFVNEKKFKYFSWSWFVFGRWENGRKERKIRGKLAQCKFLCMHALFKIICLHSHLVRLIFFSVSQFWSF